MPKFQYEARIRGKKQVGVIEADNDRAAITLLAKKNIKVQSVQLKKSWTEVELFESKQKVTERDVVLFTRQFSTMIDAGLPMVQCLDIFAKISGFFSKFKFIKFFFLIFSFSLFLTL